MSELAIAIIAGLIAGLVAAVVMNGWQALTASLFGQDKGDDDPATVKAADSVSETVEGRPVTQKHRATAGNAVHYATGAVVGIYYALLVLYWPPAAIGFGVAFGIMVMLVLDDLLVPLFGWGPAPWATPLATHAYSLTSHIVFGAVLEGVRRLAWSVLG